VCNSLPADLRKKERKIYLPRTITVSNKKNKETIRKLARSRLPEKQKAIYAGRQHCQYYYINIEKSIETKLENGEIPPIPPPTHQNRKIK